VQTFDPQKAACLHGKKFCSLVTLIIFLTDASICDHHKFRAAFHTGYVPPNVLRLTKSQLDGACSDQRYSDDFFLDLIFEKVDAETATKHLEEQEEDEEGKEDESIGENKKGKGSPVIKASSYDTMLNGDSRFWDVIEARKKEHTKKNNNNPMWGPTIGKRRGEGEKKKTIGSSTTDRREDKTKERVQLEAFSIGHDFDFLLEEPTPSLASTDKESPKDSLMEALNALDHDEGRAVPQGNGETEEIVFGETTKGAIFDNNIPSGDAITAADATDTEEVVLNTPENKGDSAQAQLKKESPTGLKHLEDMDALLASVNDDFGDVDLAGFDVDDDLDDLENYFSK
jgi:tensin